jgi:hypothetical protein
MCQVHKHVYQISIAMMQSVNIEIGVGIVKFDEGLQVDMVWLTLALSYITKHLFTETSGNRKFCVSK